MKRIESKGAIQYLQRVLAVADRIDYAEKYDFEKVRAELLEKRQTMRKAIGRWKGAANLPCGYQDAAGEMLLDAQESFHALVDAIRVCRGVWSRRLDAALDRGLS